MLTPKILIVEDEPKVALFIKKGLEENEFKTEIAYDGLEGLRVIEKNKFNAVIIDVNLPKMNGYTLCKELRTQNIHVPVLMLTALGTTDDKLKGFDAGTDDYLIKPFEFKELIARLRALIKRSGTSNLTENLLTFSDLEMNLDTMIVKRGNSKINLTAKEFALLEYFLRNRNRVLSRTEIAEKVWDHNFDTGTNVIDVYINFLRNKLDKNFSPKLIHTHIGMGYILKESEQE